MNNFIDFGNWAIFYPQSQIMSVQNSWFLPQKLKKKSYIIVQCTNPIWNIMLITLIIKAKWLCRWHQYFFLQSLSLNFIHPICLLHRVSFFLLLHGVYFIISDIHSHFRIPHSLNVNFPFDLSCFLLPCLQFVLEIAEWRRKKSSFHFLVSHHPHNSTHHCGRGCIVR